VGVGFGCLGGGLLLLDWCFAGVDCVCVGYGVCRVWFLFLVGLCELFCCFFFFFGCFFLFVGLVLLVALCFFGVCVRERCLLFVWGCAIVVVGFVVLGLGEC